MNFITNVDPETQVATVFDLRTGRDVISLPTTGLSRTEAIDMIEEETKRLAQEQDYRDDPYLASQGMNWRPQ